MYKIGSFNCLNFGRGEKKDVRKFAEIIKGENFDIIALQEIRGKTALMRILDELRKISRINWEGVADDKVTDYAFIWNSTKFELANSRESGKDWTYAPRIYQQYRIDKKAGQKELIRNPFYARFFPRRGPYIEIRLINTHIRFSKGSSEDNNFIGAVEMRRNEYDVLTKAIYAKEADKRYGNNRPAYTILLGDYNLNLPSSNAGSPYLLETFIIEDEYNPKIIRTVQSSRTTLIKEGDEEKNENNAFVNNYDHFTYDEKRFGNIISNSERVNAVKKYCADDYSTYAKTVSDHVPISIEFRLRG